jgi:hypothetical protein
MHPMMIAKVVGTGNNNIKMPVPNIPMPLVEEKDRASAVQMNIASAVAIGFRRRQVQQVSCPTSLQPCLPSELRSPSEP